MGKFIDITGQKFGRLTALKPSQKRDATGGVFGIAYAIVDSFVRLMGLHCGTDILVHADAIAQKRQEKKAGFDSMI